MTLHLTKENGFKLVLKSVEEKDVSEWIERSQQLVSPLEDEQSFFKMTLFDKSNYIHDMAKAPAIELYSLTEAMNTFAEFEGLELIEGEDYSSMQYEPESQTIIDWQNQYIYEWKHFARKFTQVKTVERESIYYPPIPLPQASKIFLSKGNLYQIFVASQYLDQIISFLHNITPETTFSQLRQQMGSFLSSLSTPIPAEVYQKWVFKICNPHAFNFETCTCEPIQDLIIIRDENQFIEPYLASFAKNDSVSERHLIIFPILFGFEGQKCIVDSTEWMKRVKEKGVEWDSTTKQWTLNKQKWIEYNQNEQQKNNISFLFLQLIDEFVSKNTKSEEERKNQIREWKDEFLLEPTMDTLNLLMKKMGLTAELENNKVSFVWNHLILPRAKKMLYGQYTSSKETLLDKLSQGESVYAPNKDELEWEQQFWNSKWHTQLLALDSLFQKERTMSGSRKESLLESIERVKNELDLILDTLTKYHLGQSNYSKEYIISLNQYIIESIQKPAYEFEDNTSRFVAFVELVKRQYEMVNLTFRTFLKDLLEEKIKSCPWNKNNPMIQQKKQSEIQSIQQAILFYRLYENHQKGRKDFSFPLSKEQVEFLNVYKKLYQKDQIYASKKLFVIHSLLQYSQSQKENDYRVFKNQIPWVNWKTKTIESFTFGKIKSHYPLETNLELICPTSQILDESIHMMVCDICKKRRPLKPFSPVELLVPQFRIQTLQNEKIVSEFGYVIDIQGQSICLPYDSVCLFLKQEPFSGYLGRYFVNPKDPTLIQFQTIQQVVSFERTDEWFYLKLDHLEPHSQNSQWKQLIFENQIRLTCPVISYYWVEQSQIQMVSFDQVKSIESIRWSCAHPFHWIKPENPSISPSDSHVLPEETTIQSIQSKFIPCSLEHERNMSLIISPPPSATVEMDKEFYSTNPSISSNNQNNNIITTTTTTNIQNPNEQNNHSSVSLQSPVVHQVPISSPPNPSLSTNENSSSIQQMEMDCSFLSAEEKEEMNQVKDKLDEYAEGIKETLEKIMQLMKQSPSFIKDVESLKDKPWNPSFLAIYEKYKSSYENDFKELQRQNDKWIYYGDWFGEFKEKCKPKSSPILQPPIQNSQSNSIPSSYSNTISQNKDSSVIYVSLTSEDSKPTPSKEKKSKKSKVKSQDSEMNPQILEKTFLSFPYGATVKQLCKKMGSCNKENCKAVEEWLLAEPQKFVKLLPTYYLFAKTIPFEYLDEWKPQILQNVKKAKLSMSDDEWNQWVKQFKTKFSK